MLSPARSTRGRRQRSWRCRRRDHARRILLLDDKGDGDRGSPLAIDLDPGEDKPEEQTVQDERKNECKQNDAASRRIAFLNEPEGQRDGLREGLRSNPRGPR